MATLNRYKLKSGKTAYMIQVMDPVERKTRRTIRLGQIPKRDAEQVRTNVARLAGLRLSGMEPDGPTADWLTKIDEDLYRKLVKFNLAPSRHGRAKPRLGETIEKYLADKRTMIKGQSVERIEDSFKPLLDRFDANTQLDDIDPFAMTEWRQWLFTRPAHRSRPAGKRLAAGTVNTHCRNIRGFFNWAVRHRMVAESPVDHLRATSSPSPDRTYVEVATIQELIDSINDPSWTLLLMIVRFGGLRTPSEITRLQWGHIEFEGLPHMLVYSPKTEAHEGKDRRRIPLLPELREVLEEHRGDPEDLVVPSVRGCSDLTNRSNLRKALLLRLERAGIKPWPKPWDSMRESLVTDLNNKNFTADRTAAWFGHDPKVQRRYYLQDSDESLRRASGVRLGTERRIGATEETSPDDCGREATM